MFSKKHKLTQAEMRQDRSLSVYFDYPRLHLSFRHAFQHNFRDEGHTRRVYLEHLI